MLSSINRSGMTVSPGTRTYKTPDEASRRVRLSENTSQPLKFGTDKRRTWPLVLLIFMGLNAGYIRTIRQVLQQNQSRHRQFAEIECLEAKQKTPQGMMVYCNLDTGEITYKPRPDTAIKGD